MGRKEYPVIALIGIFTLQTILIILFLPIIWSLVRVDLIPIRIVDQAVKAIVVGMLSVVWLYVFRYVYYRSYHWLKICDGKD